jgi:hypothetical protein
MTRSVRRLQLSSMSIESLLTQVPDEVVYRRVPLEEDRNALGPWREAVLRFVPPDVAHDLWGELVAAAEESGVATAPTSEGVDESVRELLAANHSALELLHAGIARGRLQFPEFRFPGNPLEDSEFVVHLGDIAWLPFVHSRILAADWDIKAAAGEMVNLLRMGEMICNGDGQVLHYLIGAWIRRVALSGIEHLATRQGVNVEVLELLMAAVEQSLHSPDGLAESLKADFCCITLPQLDNLPEDQELRAFSDNLLDSRSEDKDLQFPVLAGPGLQTPKDNDPADRPPEVADLLKGHPNPFEKLATAQLMGQRVAESVRTIEEASKPERLGLVGRLRQLVGGSRGKGRADSLRPPDSDCWTPIRSLAQTDIAAAREELRKIFNPVGLLLADRLLPVGVTTFMFEHRTKLEAAKRLLLERRKRCG